MQRTGWIAAAVACTMAGIAWAQPKDTIYDETQVPAYTLPDPLVMQDGTRITDADSWRSKRRPEILGLFQAHVYGRTPAAAPKITFEVTSLDAKALGGKATRKEVGSGCRGGHGQTGIILKGDKEPESRVLRATIPGR
jgi:hypothetical protein